MTGTDDTINRLAGKFGQSVVVDAACRHTGVIVPKDIARDVLLFLKNEKGLSFEALTDLFAVDYFPREPRFGVVYLLNSFTSKRRITVKVALADGEHIPTVSDIWSAANWLEREAFDMFGIHFDNHPDLRRILMIEEFDHYPLRKDFPTEGHGFDNPFSVYLEDAKNHTEQDKAE